MARGDRVVFFDVGNVLIDDDPFLCEAFRLIHKEIPPTSPKAQLDRYLGDVERCLRRYGHLAVERIGSKYLGRRWLKLRKTMAREIEGRWWKLARVIPGAREALEGIADRFRLGLLANQPPQSLDFLERHGLIPLFDVVVLDSQHSVSKPDPALFRIALEEAKVDPQDAVMVGDRLDNDIIPARRMGMRAVVLWLGATIKGWRPMDPWAQLMWPIFERLPSPRWDNLPPKERPLAMARGWNEVDKALESAWAADL